MTTPSKTYTGLDLVVFERLQEDPAIGFDRVEGTLIFHEVIFSFKWDGESSLEVSLINLPSTFEDEARAWELLEEFLSAKVVKHKEEAP